MAWGLPLMLALRGIAPDVAKVSIWSRALDGASNEDTQTSARIEVRRTAFSDLLSALPAAGSQEVAAQWPSDGLESAEGTPRHAPSDAVLAPPEQQSRAWARIDTRYVGWPFRAFSSEAWFAVPEATRENDDDQFETARAERRWASYVGDAAGVPMIVSLRPRPLGLVGDTLFWCAVSWVAVAFPTAVRRRRRERLGKCGDCGVPLDPHAVKRPDKCPECGASLPHDPLGFARSPEMHFQNHYTWFVFVSSLDIMLTWKILDRGGLEVNPVAKLVIDAWGMHGAIAFKFALMLWVIVACEILARMKRSAGKLLATLAVVISAMPVAWSLTLLLWHALVPE
ncbi:MAG: DUF5658 family protein [Phycisphaerales bacterium]